MLYAFILGRIFALSIAELLSVFERDNIEYKIVAANPEILIVDLAQPIKNEQAFLDNLGGIVKIIEVLGEAGKVSDLREILSTDKLMDRYPNIKTELENVSVPKFYWGLSVYFLCDAPQHKKQKIVRELQSYLIGVKEELRKQLAKCRIVTPPPGKFALDASGVEKNNLIKKGGEIVVLANKSKTYWGKTLAVQNFKFYSLRDYGRPGRSMKIGMMPPKLAQIMINLAQIPKGEKILDPFCGTGVVLQEALLAGYDAIGTDNDDGTISLAKQNLEWIREILKEKATAKLENPIFNEFPMDGNYELARSDAKEIIKIVPKCSISAIVTEGTLGPRYGRQLPTGAQIKANFAILEKLYLAAFTQFREILKENGKVVITFPVYILKKHDPAFAPFIDKIKELGYNTISPIKADETGKVPFLLSKNGTIVYSRPDQIVGREIIIFSKK